MRIFTATIDKTDSVHDLKRCIKAEKSPGFDHLAADELILWKLEPPSLVGRETDLQTALEALRALKLDDSTTEARRGQLHIIVQVPTTTNMSGFFTPPLEQESAKRLRTEHNDRFPSAPPSQAGVEQYFKRLQEQWDGPFAYCNRPASASSIPVTLMHPIFAQFVADSRTYEPTPADNALVLELCMEMSATFHTQEDRRRIFTSVLQSHYEIDLIAGKLTGDGFSSDGHRVTNGFLDVCTVAAGAGSCGGVDPFLRGCVCYHEASRAQIVEHSFSALPCLLLVYSGLAYSDRPHMDMLGPLLPLSGHHHDCDMKTTAARSLGAFRNATRSLAKYYNEELPGFPNPLYPYPSSYRPLTGEPVHQDFKYLGKFGGAADNTRLLFYAETIGPAGNQKDLIIKFVRRYSKAAHELCAALGYAPTLHGFEELPGGWLMAVMQRLPDSYGLYHGLGLDEEAKAAVAQLLSDCIGRLHEANMVHGDVRSVNLLVRTDGEIGIKVVDFDWAGGVGVVRYPINVNRDGIARPDTARDGMLVTKEHDLDMIKFMFRP
ncbi:hypothetical protein HWV62_14184 [Athelia sp. TMB]|nr:hypothetical protein HWV62_14184 [Athelia sp. TMB]